MYFRVRWRVGGDIDIDTTKRTKYMYIGVLYRFTDIIIFFSLVVRELSSHLCQSYFLFFLLEYFIEIPSFNENVILPFIILFISLYFIKWIPLSRIARLTVYKLVRYYAGLIVIVLTASWTEGSEWKTNFIV